MDNFYAQADRKLQEAIAKQNSEVVETWQNCVLSAAEKGIPPSQVECKLNFRPRPAAVESLQTETLKLEVVHIPARVEDDNDGYPPYTMERHIPEEYYLRVKRPESDTGCSIQ
jgi:hypothetical protein